MLIYIYILILKRLPGELEETAWIDGAGLFKNIFLIWPLPSSSVVFTTVTIFALVWHWNDYYLAIMYLSDNFPLAVKIYDIKSAYSSENMGRLSGIDLHKVRRLLYVHSPAAFGLSCFAAEICKEHRPRGYNRLKIT